MASSSQTLDSSIEVNLSLNSTSDTFNLSDSEPEPDSRLNKTILLSDDDGDLEAEAEKGSQTAADNVPHGDHSSVTIQESPRRSSGDKRPHSPEALELQDEVKRKCEPPPQFPNSSKKGLNILEDCATNTQENPTSSGNDNVLPATVTQLTHPSGGQLFLVGTAHFSRESQEDVAKTIRLIQPHIVTVELCKSRINLLQLDEETILQEAKDINFSKVKLTVQQNGMFNGMMYILLLSMSAHLTRELGMAPGGEFRRAFSEAKKVPGCQVHLGDRPIQITLQRALSSLSWWQTTKLAWHILTSKEPISKEEVERCKQKDLLEEMLAEMTGEFPALSHVFVYERDLFLAHSLALATQPIPTPQGPEPARVVGVVGIGHIPGIVKMWGKVAEEDIKPIMVIPPQSRTSKVLKFTVKVSVLGLLVWGVSKMVPLPVPRVDTVKPYFTSLVNVRLMEDPYCHSDIWLVYSSSNLPGPGSDTDLFDALLSQGCSCDGGKCDSSNCVCVAKYGPNYTNNGTIINVDAPILECNAFCLCSKNLCKNRLVQKGPRLGLEVFNKCIEMGLGLRTNLPITRGSFVCEYAGEVLGGEVAAERARRQGPRGNYIIVVREHHGSGLTLTRVDPTYVGNIGRYANHSCSPSMFMVPVRSFTPIPHLALFASKDVPAGAELTFDYAGAKNVEDTSSETARSETPCRCGSANCRGFLPFDPSLLLN